jgi:hypothetical protein
MAESAEMVTGKRLARIGLDSFYFRGKIEVMVFQKGREESGGRKKGTPNGATESIKNALDALLPEHEFVAHWNRFL